MSSYTHLQNLAASLGMHLASPQHTGLLSSHTAGLAYPSSRAQRDTMRGADHAPLQEGPAPATEIDYNTRELLFTEIYLYNLGAGSILRLRY